MGMAQVLIFVNNEPSIAQDQIFECSRVLYWLNIRLAAALFMLLSWLLAYDVVFFCVW